MQNIATDPSTLSNHFRLILIAGVAIAAGIAAGIAALVSTAAGIAALISTAAGIAALISTATGIAALISTATGIAALIGAAPIASITTVTGATALRRYYSGRCGLRGCCSTLAPFFGII